MFTYGNAVYRCTSEVALELVSGKWKVLILSYLADNVFRFNELQRLMPGTTQKMLTMQLRDLENDGLIIRTVYAVSPPKVEYRLSELGEKLMPILRNLCEFGAEYVKARGEEAPRSSVELHESARSNSI